MFMFISNLHEVDSSADWGTTRSF